MHVVCLDLEGVLVPEIWIEFSKATGLSELMITTRDEPDYDKLMKYRLDVLDRNNLKLADIQRVIGSMEPLDGARSFIDTTKSLCQVIILSDTFSEFAKPLMEKLGYPTLFCNSLVIDPSGRVAGYTLRQKDGKKKAVEALQSLNMKVLAAGDSYNDLTMIHTANTGALFHAPASIITAHPEVPAYETYGELLEHIRVFLQN